MNSYLAKFTFDAFGGINSATIKKIQQVIQHIAATNPDLLLQSDIKVMFKKKQDEHRIWFISKKPRFCLLSQWARGNFVKAIMGKDGKDVIASEMSYRRSRIEIHDNFELTTLLGNSWDLASSQVASVSRSFYLFWSDELSSRMQKTADATHAVMFIILTLIKMLQPDTTNFMCQFVHEYKEPKEPMDFKNYKVPKWAEVESQAAEVTVMSSKVLAFIEHMLKLTRRYVFHNLFANLTRTCIHAENNSYETTFIIKNIHRILIERFQPDKTNQIEIEQL